MKTRIFGDKKSGSLPQASAVGNGLAVSADFSATVRGNGEFKFSKISGDHDFHLMISKEQE